MSSCNDCKTFAIIVKSESYEMISNAGIIPVLWNLSLSIFSLSVLAIRLLTKDIGRSNEYEISSGFRPIFDRPSTSR
jgi:hypothetical protein